MIFGGAFRAIKLHRWLAIGIFVSSQLVTAAYWFLTSQQYKATTRVLMTGSPSPMRTVLDDTSGSIRSSRVALLRSRLVADRVVARLGLVDLVELQETWKAIPEPKASFRDWLAALISVGLMTEDIQASYIYSVTYFATGPEFAKTMADAFAYEWIETVNAINQRSDEKVGALLATDAVIRRRNMEVAQTELLELSRRSGVAFEGFWNPEIKRYYGLSKLAGSGSRASLEQAAVVNAVRESADSSALFDDSFLVERREFLARLMAAQASTLALKGATHPDSAILEAGILGVKRQISAYEAKTRDSLESGSQRLRRSSDAFEKERANAQSELLASAEQRLEYDEALRKAVDAGEQYVGVSAKVGFLELNKGGQKGDMQVIQKAIQNGEVWYPKLSYVIPTSLVAGFVLMFLGCRVVASRNKILFSEKYLSEVVGAPSIGHLLKGGKH